MEGYQDNLRDFVEVVESKLNSFVWGYLSEELKEELHITEDETFSYLKYKHEVAADLEERGLLKILKDAKVCVILIQSVFYHV